ncbi:MAG: protoporphyrinogen oxidase HemJ [Pseudomonadota bacterium]
MEGIQDFLSSVYPWTLAFHVISVLAWMAGLFYLPRLFVYHVEKAGEDPDLDLIYQEMERKLIRAIMNPAMIATWVFGLMMVFTPGIVNWAEWWPWIKAAAVVAMTWFHHSLSLSRKAFVAGKNTKSGRHFRLINEIPTVLMIIIVIMVIVRPI